MNVTLQHEIPVYTSLLIIFAVWVSVVLAKLIEVGIERRYKRELDASRNGMGVRDLRRDFWRGKDRVDTVGASMVPGVCFKCGKVLVGVAAFGRCTDCLIPENGMAEKY